MSVPTSLKSLNHVVYCYTSELEKTSKALAKLLGGTYIRVLLKGSAVASVSDYHPKGSNAAWLVGHGLKTNDLIGTSTHSAAIDIKTLLDYLAADSFTSVVDTCCEPDQRRLVAAKSKLTYYCAADGRQVTQVVDASSLDSWWSANGMH